MLNEGPKTAKLCFAVDLALAFGPAMGKRLERGVRSIHPFPEAVADPHKNWCPPRHLEIDLYHLVHVIGIELPAALDAEYTAKLAALRQSDAANLDQAYLSTQVASHEEAVNLFDSYSKQRPDGQLKRTAAKVLPELRMHLTRIRGLTSK